MNVNIKKEKGPKMEPLSIPTFTVREEDKELVGLRRDGWWGAGGFTPTVKTSSGQARQVSGRREQSTVLNIVQ